MLLTKVTIDSFRTLTTSQNIEIDTKMTVLMGANESGKTNLLQAIHCISLTNDFQTEDISKCRRRRYARKEPPSPLPSNLHANAPDSFAFTINFCILSVTLSKQYF